MVLAMVLLRVPPTPTPMLQAGVEAGAAETTCGEIVNTDAATITMDAHRRKRLRKPAFTHTEVRGNRLGTRYKLGK
jgi:hypothetical protein